MGVAARNEHIRHGHILAMNNGVIPYIISHLFTSIFPTLNN